MPLIKAKDLREKTDQELLDQLAVEKKKLFDATVRGASGEAIKPHQKRNGKRLIAKIQTILRERALRSDLEQKAVVLEPKTEGAHVKIVRQLKKGARPQLKRAKLRHFRLEQATQTDRNAVKLLEARRLRAALERQDPGQNK